MGKPAVPAMLTMLKNDNPELRRGAVAVLGGIKDTSTIKPISHLLKDQDEKLRIAGIEALAEIGTAHCLALIESCLQDPSEKTRENAAYWYKDLASTLGNAGQS